MSNLLKAMNSNREQLQEIAALKDVAKKIGSTLGGLLKSVENSSKESKPEELPNRQLPVSSGSATGNITTIVSELIDVPAGEIRYVIHLPHGELTSKYLQQGGGQLIVNAIEEGKLSTIFDGTHKYQLSQLPDGAKLADIIKTNLDRTVVINVPSAINKEIETAKSSGDENALKASLVKAMSHRYYVLSINNTKAKNSVAAFDAAQSIDEKVAVFDIDMLENYPVRQILTAARKEHSQAHGEGKKQSDLDKLRADKDHRDEVEKLDPEGTDAKKQLKTAVPQIIADEGGDIEKAASAFYSNFKGKFSKEAVIKQLEAFATTYESKKAFSIADRLKTGDLYTEWK